MSRIVRVWLLGVALIGCTTPDRQVEETGTTRQAVGETVSTDKAVYAFGESVIVSFTGLPGNATDWVALSLVGSPDTSISKWAYTFGSVNGSHTFAGANVGQYEARVYENNTFNLLARSAAFQVNPNAGMPTVTSDKATYQPSESALISFSGMAGYEQDWISIAPQNSQATAYVKWFYTGGVGSGSHLVDLAGLNGTYVARAHFNNGFTIDAESAPFTVAVANTTVSVNKSTFAFGETVTLSYANMLGSPKDWLAVVDPASPDDETAFLPWWEYTGPNFSGQVTLNTLPPGTYQARVYFEDSFARQATSANFTVGAYPALPTTLTTDKTSYTGLEPVFVTYTGMPNSGTDWLAAADPRSDMRNFGAWTYAPFQNATHPLYGLPFGTWEIRAFWNNNYDLKGRTSFTVTMSAGVASEFPTYTTNDQVLIRFGGMYGDLTDWVGIFAPGAANNQFVEWSYTRGEPIGGRYFSAASLGPGTYVARVFFQNSTDSRAESASFTIQ